MTKELPIFARIHSRYQVFDASGQLPFSIVFGLGRLALTDTDSRPVLLGVSGSALDAPYALSHGLLTLHEQDPQDHTRLTEVDLSRLGKIAAREQEEYVSLPSPVGRKRNLKDSTVHLAHIDAKGPLASILEHGKKYVIRLKSKDLGVKSIIYGDAKSPGDPNEKSEDPPEVIKLANSKHTGGKAAFTVVAGLSWPPRIETKLRLCTASSDPVDLNMYKYGDFLEVSVTNQGSNSVTLQTRGHQRCLIPWGPFQPEPDAIDHRARIIYPASNGAPTSSLQVIDATGRVVRESKPSGIAPLTTGNADQRPREGDLLTLEPGLPIIRKIDIRGLLKGLDNGEYKLRIIPKPCRWWHGDVVHDIDEDGKLLAHRCKELVPPVMLTSREEVEICIRNHEKGK